MKFFDANAIMGAQLAAAQSGSPCSPRPPLCTAACTFQVAAPAHHTVVVEPGLAHAALPLSSWPLQVPLSTSSWRLPELRWPHLDSAF